MTEEQYRRAMQIRNQRSSLRDLDMYITRLRDGQEPFLCLGERFQNVWSHASGRKFSKYPPIVEELKKQYIEYARQYIIDTEAELLKEFEEL